MCQHNPRPCVITVAHLSPAQQRRPRQHSPTAASSWPVAARASHGSQLCSCRFRVVVTPSAPTLGAGAVPGSPMGAVLCSFSLSSHCSLRCCAPKPWDRGLLRVPARAGSPFRKGEAKPGLCVWPAGQDCKRTEESLPWADPQLLTPHPHVVSSRSPYQQILQFKHFVNVQRADPAIQSL